MRFIMWLVVVAACGTTATPNAAPTPSPPVDAAAVVVAVPDAGPVNVDESFTLTKGNPHLAKSGTSWTLVAQTWSDGDPRPLGAFGYHSFTVTKGGVTKTIGSRSEGALYAEGVVFDQLYILTTDAGGVTTRVQLRAGPPPQPIPVNEAAAVLEKDERAKQLPEGGMRQTVRHEEQGVVVITGWRLPKKGDRELLWRADVGLYTQEITLTVEGPGGQ